MGAILALSGRSPQQCGSARILLAAGPPKPPELRPSLACAGIIFRPVCVRTCAVRHQCLLPSLVKTCMPALAIASKMVGIGAFSMATKKRRHIALLNSIERAGSGNANDRMIHTWPRCLAIQFSEEVVCFLSRSWSHVIAGRQTPSQI